MANNVRHAEISKRTGREAKTVSTKTSGDAQGRSSWKYRSKEQSIIAEVRGILLTDGYASLETGLFIQSVCRSYRMCTIRG
jgi:hypothetical protein